MVLSYKQSIYVLDKYKAKLLNQADLKTLKKLMNKIRNDTSATADPSAKESDHDTSEIDSQSDSESNKNKPEITAEVEPDNKKQKLANGAEAEPEAPVDAPVDPLQGKKVRVVMNDR